MAFSAGFDGVIKVNSVDISDFTTDVKFKPARKGYDLPTLGGSAVKSMVGPVKTMIDLKGFLDPTATAVFTSLMAQTTPASVPIEYDPQGSTVGLPKRSASAFCVDYEEDSPSEGPATWSATLAVDGVVTYGTN